MNNQSLVIDQIEAWSSEFEYSHESVESNLKIPNAQNPWTLVTSIFYPIYWIGSIHSYGLLWSREVTMGYEGCSQNRAIFLCSIPIAVTTLLDMIAVAGASRLWLCVKSNAQRWKTYSLGIRRHCPECHSMWSMRRRRSRGIGTDWSSASLTFCKWLRICFFYETDQGCIYFKSTII